MADEFIVEHRFRKRGGAQSGRLAIGLSRLMSTGRQVQLREREALAVKRLDFWVGARSAKGASRVPFLFVRAGQVSSLPR